MSSYRNAQCRITRTLEIRVSSYVLGKGKGKGRGKGRARPLPKGNLKNIYKTQDQQIELFYGWSSEVDRVLDVFRVCQEDPELSSHYFCNENMDMAPLQHLCYGRIVFLGDSSHPMGSLFGLSANLGLEEAYEFVEKLVLSETYSNALVQFEQKHLLRHQKFIELESQKKQFLLHASEGDLLSFYEFLKSASFEDFFNPLLGLLRE